MSKLCLGTFLKTVKICSMKSINQKKLVGIIMLCFDMEFDDTDDSACSNLVRGIKNPSKRVMDAVNSLSVDEIKDVRDMLITGTPFINPNRETALRKALIMIIENDDEIDDTAVVELIDNTTKGDLRFSKADIMSFVTGILIYVLKNTDNTGKKEFTDEITEKYVESANAMICLSDTNDSKESVINEIIDVSNHVDDIYDDTAETEARRFCVKYEKEISLLPLCQIAFMVDPTHRNVRQMYTDYCLCSLKVRKKIFSLKHLPWLDDSEDWIYKSVEQFRRDMKEQGYTKVDFLYEGAKYFHRAYQYYSERRIKDYSPEVFDILDKKTWGWMGARCADFEQYVGDFFYMKEHFPDEEYDPPGDHMWNVCSLGNCPEADMTFWVCKFIIVCCTRMMQDKEIQNELWDNVSFDYNYLETMEDLYFYALLHLYYNYMV